MALFGGLAAGAFGIFIGGCIGAILRDTFPALPTSSRKVSGPLDERNCKSAAFAVAVIGLAAKVAKVDGAVTAAETQTFDLFLRNTLLLSKQDREDASRLLGRACDSSTPASEFALQLGRTFRSEPDRLRDAIEILLTIALSDGHVHEEEEELIRRIARDMGLSAADYRSCTASLHAIQGDGKACPFETLGIETSASNNEIRAAHRRMVREYHPDVLQSKGLPEEFLIFAKAKLLAANTAWAALKKEREI